MKLNNKIIYSSLLFSCLMGACNIEDTGIPQPSQLKLESEEYDVRIYPGEETDAGLVLRWVDIASGEYIITLSDGAKTTSLEIADNSLLDENVRSMIITNDKLLEYISALGIDYKENVTVPLTLSIAAMDQYGNKNHVSASLSVTLVSVVYMVATMKGGEKEYIEMMETDTGTGIFSWSGELEACTYHFVSRQDKEYPLYAKGSDENSLVYLRSEGEYDEFTITKRGMYVIVMDKNTLSVDRQFPIFEVPGLWVIGGACSTVGDWNLSRCFTMKNDPDNPEIWTYTGTFYSNGGSSGNYRSFKVAFKKNTWENKYFFFAANDWAEPTTWQPMLSFSEKDYKWLVTATGIYRLTVNLNTVKLLLERIS